VCEPLKVGAGIGGGRQLRHAVCPWARGPLLRMVNGLAQGLAPGARARPDPVADPWPYPL